MVATLGNENETVTTAPEKKKSVRPRAAATGSARGLSMEKWMCWGALGAAVIMALLFLLDLFLSWPFAGASMTLDIFGILAAGVIGFLAVDTLREFK
jgi:hypothetical protein